MRKLILVISISLLAFVGSALMPSEGEAENNCEGIFQILALSAIGGAEFPESEGWIQKRRRFSKPTAVTYVCNNGNCAFDVLTANFKNRSVRECSAGAEVSFIGNILVIPADCTDPILTSQ